MSEWLTLKTELGLTLRPIDTWPGKLRPSWQREPGPYSAPLKDTLKTLKRELNALSARNIVLQIAIREGDLRLDGLPRSGARAEHPGVILCFDVHGGFRRRAFDRFSKWDQNLRALALNLEHLRLANLYGVEGDEQQYAGWKALPAASDTPQDALDYARVLARFCNCPVQEILASEITASAERLQSAYREAVSKTHPDKGGDPADFRDVHTAYKALRACLAPFEGKGQNHE